MSITIVKASYRHGYTGTDHLLNDGDFDPAIGREFRSLRDAARALNRMASTSLPPIWVEYRVAGETREATV